MDGMVNEPFPVMLPAFNGMERSAAEGMVAGLINSGCREFCCVGQQAEQLHDAIDWIIEDRHALDIVTTWHQDIVEACEYFLFAAGIGTNCRIALVSEHAAVVSLLLNLVGGGTT
jgi:hypothetical protein